MHSHPPPSAPPPYRGRRGPRAHAHIDFYTTATKYTDQFGPGAFVFLRGFSSDLLPTFKGFCHLLDMTPFDVSSFDREY